ncbi:hypothetical protein [Bacteroides cellulosilyticus]|uniref:Uncharacterized protein n=1 Tax=Bacteroides cellulosilyticus TaxID=246787 RepID=A0A642PPE9_9BACE|nr:hypothetical protein [Bacteroides cellulosilyticus]KAA5411956.1 hypothetical protein F2Y81_27510 [Bacteroides cellulosilyticus]
MVKVKISSLNDNVSGYACISVVDPKIIDGYWMDEQGKQITLAYLGETVRFKIRTKDLIGKTLSVYLYDSKKETFNGSMIKMVRVSNDSLIFNIELDKEWSIKLFQNEGNALLYIDVEVEEYPHIRKQLPDNKKDFLEIRPKCLYVNSYGKDNLPYIYSRKGEKLSLGELSEKASNAIKDVLKDDIDEFKDNAFKYYITKNKGTKIAKGLKVFRKAISIADGLDDVKDIVKAILTKGESVSDMTLPLVGAYYPIAVAAKLVIDDMVEEMEDVSKEADLELLNRSIEQGLWSVNKYIEEYNSDGVTYKLVNISIDTFIDILNNRFYTLDEVISCANNTPIEIDKDIVMLCYTIRRKKIEVSIIKAFFTENI